MNDTTDQFTDALRDLLKDQCTLRHVRDIEAGGPASSLWDALESSGFADALLPESQGGAGLSLADAFALFELCGSFALPVPLAETMVARAFLADAGVKPPPGSIALAKRPTRAMMSGVWRWKRAECACVERMVTIVFGCK